MNWYPDHIKHGRFGDWLANNVDWSLSRNRYWGTPLPMWRCPQDHVVCIGEVADLAERAGRDLSGLDLHRPSIDEITFGCTECGGEMRRVREVIDAWYDSGSMPFAQWHYPFEREDIFERRFPADYICEGIDQTRGWFYSLLAIGTLLWEQSAYRTASASGSSCQETGEDVEVARERSRPMGDPRQVRRGRAPVVLLHIGQPVGLPPRGFETIAEVQRGFQRMLWNVYSFYTLYANTENIDPTTAGVPVAERHELDRWLLAELHDTMRVGDRSPRGIRLHGGRHGGSPRSSRTSRIGTCVVPAGASTRRRRSTR